jgi:hypothetical protein
VCGPRLVDVTRWFMRRTVLIFVLVMIAVITTMIISVMATALLVS